MVDVTPVPALPSPSTKAVERADRLRKFWSNKTKDMDIDPIASDVEPNTAEKHGADEIDAPAAKRVKPEAEDADIVAVVGVPAV